MLTICSLVERVCVYREAYALHQTERPQNHVRNFLYGYSAVKHREAKELAVFSPYCRWNDAVLPHLFLCVFIHHSHKKFLLVVQKCFR